MIALELTDVKNFMNTLLRTETFDRFLLSEAVISGAVRYTIDGRINPSFYSKEEAEELGIADFPALPFSMLRARCFDLIKGKKTPSSFSFVLRLSPSASEKLIAAAPGSFTPQDVTGIFLNLRFQNQLLTLTTGISYAIFSPDRTLEREWDSAVLRFLKQKQIPYEEL